VQQRLLTTLQPLFSSNPPPSSASSPLALLHDLLVPASLRKEEALPLAGAIPAAATTAASLLLVFLAVLASAMASSSPTSWASRFGAWGGRFSPFGRASTAARAGEVGEGDYSYITSEDIARGADGGGGGGAGRPERETDALLLKHRSVSYPVHFPAYSVDDGELTVGKVRAAAAKKLGLPEAEAARVKLFYRGRNLKDDARAARAEGLRSADQPEILVVVGSAAQAAAQQAQRPPVRGAEEIEDDDGDDDEGDDDDGDDADGKPGRKKRNRKKKSKRSKKAAPAPADDARRAPPNPDATFAPVAAPIAPSPSSGGAAAPQTALQRLDAITSSFRAAILPACERFLASPPPEAERRAAEHRRLTETVLAQVLLKLDAVDTEGDEEARGRRKELVREAQGLLGRLDGVVGK
jgi:hypothetical protein